MARDHTNRPMIDDELDEVREAIRDQRGEIREYLEEEGVDVDSWGDDSGETTPNADRETADSD